MIQIYDTTLRDGTQAEDFSLSVEDKVRIALKLDEIHVDFIEGGWPGSNPKDEQFFKEIKNYALKHARIAAFGSTQQAKYAKPEEDSNLNALVQSGASVVTIFGKTWDVHVTDALRITLERNLEIIKNSVSWLKGQVSTVFYDAEHFFDGFKANKAYAMQTIKQALHGGTDCLVLCDTNGGTLPHEIYEIVQLVHKELPNASLGIHCHNDSDVAVANSLMAVRAGAMQVQGTMNGFGERCGNANLCSIIPALAIKMNLQCHAGAFLASLTDVSRYVSEIANLPHNKYQPYVGRSAFAHKGGVHVSAVSRNASTYEHMAPELVGNHRRILVSDLSGKSNVLAKARQFGLDIESHDPVIMDIVARLKELESQGFQFEGAEASFELLMRRAMGQARKYFDLIGFRVIDQKVEEDAPPQAEATVMIRVGGHVEHTAAVGEGPVNALDNAIRKALEKFYPVLKDVSLVDYKVRVLPGVPGTCARVRVLIESTDRHDKWGTVGVSHDILEASWQALLDSISYKLLKIEQRGE